MGLEAATKALLDAGITYDNVEAAYVGYCYGDSTSGQVCLLHRPRCASLNAFPPACAVQPGSHGHTNNKCEQQLLHGKHGALPRARSRQGGTRPVRVGPRLRTHGAWESGHQLSR